MFYYNQCDYSKITYPSSGHPKATIKSGGCGVVSTLILVNNLAGKELYTVQSMRDLAIKSGARVAEGTAVYVLLNAVKKAYRGFSYTTTSSEADLIKHLKAGGMAIVHQGNDYNVFSSAGHYVTAVSMNGDNIEIYDPYMYTGKYSSSPRSSRIVKKTKYGCVVSKSEINKATADRSPSYYLVTYKEPSNKPAVKVGDKVTFTDTRKCYKGYGSATGAYKINELTAFGSDDVATRRKNTTANVTAVKTLASGNVWIEYKLNNHKVYSCIYDKKTNKKHIK